MYLISTEKATKIMFILSKKTTTMDNFTGQLNTIYFCATCDELIVVCDSF